MYWYEIEQTLQSEFSHTLEFIWPLSRIERESFFVWHDKWYHHHHHHQMFQSIKLMVFIKEFTMSMSKTDLNTVSVEGIVWNFTSWNLHLLHLLWFRITISPCMRDSCNRQKKKKNPTEESTQMKTLTFTCPWGRLCNKRRGLIFIQIES